MQGYSQDLMASMNNNDTKLKLFLSNITAAEIGLKQAGSMPED